MIGFKFAHSIGFGMELVEKDVCHSEVVGFVLGAWYKVGGPYTPGYMGSETVQHFNL